MLRANPLESDLDVKIKGREGVAEDDGWIYYHDMDKNLQININKNTVFQKIKITYILVNFKIINPISLFVIFIHIFLFLISF